MTTGGTTRESADEPDGGGPPEAAGTGTAPAAEATGADATGGGAGRGTPYPDPSTDEELLLLAAYLLSSGRGLLDEPQVYGTFRCVDATRRVLVLLRRRGVGHEELDRLHRELEDFMCGPMTPRDLPVFLDDLCGRFTVLLRDSDLIAPAPVRAPAPAV
ncbi:DUF6092 family protein [Streptomyces sp. NPDC006798]|uniref:DUF6092 family protein n=1 Tax=Streptomyces sp. NPDC006798 TaxID=3155462 RepID=UPI0033C8B07F